LSAEALIGCTGLPSAIATFGFISAQTALATVMAAPL
jgi:hypothetical protein